ncbi:hypothetical protein [Hymenobacter sp. CRA2]|uniref:hypothetical protein n=1 Tax=Hymenobacter sp. CRA2 TaxID=1955620 RepID=UPI00098EC6BF|nr:hypothetical protein [Hymenobacter sp. CRA2]OON70793.1 hypothetical protein B0919_01925 [Hymenobacter sp. CRA2]
MLEYSPVRQSAYYFLLFVLLVLLVPQVGHPGDVGCWSFWACYMAEHGLGNVYEDPGNIYNPVYQYILWLYTQFTGNVETIKHYIHFVKAFVLVFDFAGAIWAASLVTERTRRFELSLLLLLNVGYLYNTLIWQQIDAIYTFWAFGAVVLAARQKAVWSALLYTMALSTKTQAIIFLPPLLLLWAPLWWQRPRRLLEAVGASALLLLALLVPFIWGAERSQLPRMIEMNFGVVDLVPVISANAFNFWALVAPDVDLMNTMDSEPFLGLTYKLWGLLLFFSFSAAVLMPLLVHAVRSILRLRREGRSAAVAPSLPLALLSTGMVPLLFAFFNTQMHERYWHACILFLAAYGFLTRRYWPYVVASVAYFLNLEAVLRFLQLKKYSVLIFHPAFVGGLFGIVIVLGLVYLYRPVRWRREPALAEAPLVEVA